MSSKNGDFRKTKAVRSVRLPKQHKKRKRESVVVLLLLLLLSNAQSAVVVVALLKIREKGCDKSGKKKTSFRVVVKKTFIVRPLSFGLLNTKRRRRRWKKYARKKKDLKKKKKKKKKP